jgi:hydroxyacylglutathione hydrolase
MKIDSLTVGPFAENTWFLIDKGQAAVIDPGFSTEQEFAHFRELLDREKADLIAVLLTHAHIDHVMGLGRVLQTWDVPVWLNHSDLHLWNDIETQAALFGIRAKGYDFTPQPLDAQEQFTVGPFSMDVLFTPGHSPDHVSLYLPDRDVVIAGDALFRESIGRTDLYKGDQDQLFESIRTRLYNLPDHTRVLPGHGPETTIGHEKSHNPFVRG